MTHEVREMAEGQRVCSLETHGKDFAFYSER